MRRAFAGLAVLLLFLVIAQFYFAAAGGFSHAPREEAYGPHHALGYAIFVLPLAMIIFAALARRPVWFVGMLAVVAGLTGLQVLIAKLATGHGYAGSLFFGLHAINGLAILAATGAIAHRARTQP